MRLPARRGSFEDKSSVLTVQVSQNPELLEFQDLWLGRVGKICGQARVHSVSLAAAAGQAGRQGS